MYGHAPYFVKFSLMQSVGNMQGFKGKYCEDRLDKFLFYLNCYYETEVDKRKKLTLLETHQLKIKMH